MNAEIDYLDLSIKEENTPNENGLDENCKASGFLYVDMNDYNENNLDGVEIKEEEEQVEDLISEKNTSENNGIYVEENLSLNSPKNLTNYPQNDSSMTEAETLIKHKKKKKGFCSKSVQKENISVKSQMCSGTNEYSGTKGYTLRARTWSQKRNLEFNKNISEKRKNVKFHNEIKSNSNYNNLTFLKDNSILSRGAKKKSYKCLYCKKFFSTEYIYNAHIKICKFETLKCLKFDCTNNTVYKNDTISVRDSNEFKVISYKCNNCNKTFKKKNSLASHISKSKCSSADYTCALCDQTFLWKSCLKKHIVAHIKNQTQCQWFKINNSGNLSSNHYEDEINKSSNSCGKFNKTCVQSNSQGIYLGQGEGADNKCAQSCKFMETVDNQSFKVSYSKIFNCQFCKKKFKGIFLYKNHLKSHMEDHSCNAENGTAFPRCLSFVDVKNCLRSSSEKKKNKYKCDICGKLFIKLVKLKIHILNIHQGVNFQCEKCNLKFISQEDLDAHVTKQTCMPVDLCTCKTCGKVFAKRDYLKKHQYVHLNILFKCKYCYCAFMKEKSYKKHMEKMNCSKSARKIRMAEFNFKKCRLCGVEYETEELLIKHFRISHVGLEPHQCFCCDSCLPTFQELQNHIHQHNIQKYTCTLCGKPYTSQEGFRKHRLKHKGAEFKCKFCESEFLNENRFKFHEKTCKKNPESSFSEKKEKPKKKDSKPKQSRQLHWESRIIMKRLRGDPTSITGDQKCMVDGKEDSFRVSTFFDEPESDTNNERGWFDNYYKTEEDDIAFGLKRAEELSQVDYNLGLDEAKVPLRGPSKKSKTSSSTLEALSTVNSDTTGCREVKVNDYNYSFSSSEDSSTELDEEIPNTSLPIDYNPKKCRLCVISFGQEYELLHHFIKSHAGEYAHMCPCCGMQSPLYAQLKEHMKTHGIGIGVFNCDNCSKQFKSEKKMNSHNIRCKGIKNDISVPVKVSVSQPVNDGCKRCGKKFLTKFGYRRHRLLCKKKLCNKNSKKLSADLGQLEVQIAKQESVASCLLQNNPIQFSEPEGEEEEKTAIGELESEKTPSVLNQKLNSTKTENCPSVTAKPPEEEQKKTEIKSIYSGEPPMDSFPCRLCDKKFQYERGIVMHFKSVHPGNKPLICHVCNMHLADKLKEHLKTHGIGEEFICELCGKRFNQKFLSKIHEMWHEGIEYKCNNCKQKFLNKEKMDKHIGENRCSNRQSLMRLPCDICGKSYRSKFGLSKHYITHTPKELRPVKNRMNCEYCGKWFENNNGLQRHRRIHTGERPFCCRFCPKAFAQEGNCKAHERIHTGESKPRKKKLSTVASVPSQLSPPNSLIPNLSAVPHLSLPASTVESIPYAGPVNLYNYNNTESSGIVH